MRRSIHAAVVVAVCLRSGAALRAQTPLPTAEAEKFMGAWLLTLDSPQGPFAMTMTLTDVDGKAACELTSDIMPAQKVADVMDGQFMMSGVGTKK